MNDRGIWVEMGLKGWMKNDSMRRLRIHTD